MIKKALYHLLVGLGQGLLFAGLFFLLFCSCFFLANLEAICAIFGPLILVFDVVFLILIIVFLAWVDKSQSKP